MERFEHIRLGGGGIPLTGDDLERRLRGSGELPNLDAKDIVLTAELNGHDITLLDLAIYLSDSTHAVRQSQDSEEAPKPATPLRRTIPAHCKLIRVQGTVLSSGPLKAAAEARELEFEWIEDAGHQTWIRIPLAPFTTVVGLTVDPAALARETQRVLSASFAAESYLPSNLSISKLQLEAATPRSSELRISGQVRVKWYLLAATIHFHGTVRVRLGRRPELHYTQYFFSRHPLMRWILAYARSKMADDLTGTTDLSNTGITNLKFAMTDAEAGSQVGEPRQVLMVDAAFDRSRPA